MEESAPAFFHLWTRNSNRLQCQVFLLNQNANVNNPALAIVTSSPMEFLLYEIDDSLDEQQALVTVSPSSPILDLQDENTVQELYDLYLHTIQMFTNLDSKPNEHSETKAGSIT